MLIAADVGGTKTHLAISSSEAGPHLPLAKSRFTARITSASENRKQERTAEHGSTRRSSHPAPSR
jgi:hypothetical protein